MLSSSSKHFVSWLFIVSLLSSLVGPVTAQAQSAHTTAPITPASTSYRANLDVPANFRPTGAASESFPASDVTQLRQSYAATHTLNGVFDGSMSTPTTEAYYDGRTITLQGATGENIKRESFTVPAGDYDSVQFDASISGHDTGTYHTLTFRFRSLDGVSPWISIQLLQVEHTSQSVSALKLMFGYALKPNLPIEVEIVCQDSFNQGYPFECSASNFHFTTTSHGLHHTDNTTMAVNNYPLAAPNNAITTGISAGSAGTLPANDGSFFTFQTVPTAGGAVALRSGFYDSVLLRLPVFSASQSLTMSVAWARKTITPSLPSDSNSYASGATFFFAPLGGSQTQILTLPSDKNDYPWTTVGSGAFPQSLSGKVGTVRIEKTIGYYGHIMGIDSIQFFLDGKPVALPADQVVGACSCNAGSQTQAVKADPVNTFTGSFNMSVRDIGVASAGPELAFERTYTSLFADTSAYPTTPLGSGWRHSYSAALTLPSAAVGGEANTVIYEASSGNRLRFFDDGSTALSPAPGVRAELAHASGVYTMTLRDQSLMVFDANGRLTEQRDPKGHRETLAYYGSTGTNNANQLQTVTDVGSGRTLTFTYTSSGGGVRLADVTDSAGRKVEYTYTNGDLTGAKDLRLQTTTYGYNGSTHLLTTIVDPASVNQLTNTYDLSKANRPVSQQLNSAGVTTLLSYTTTATGQDTTITRRKTGLTDDVSIDHYRADGTLEYQEHAGLLQSYATFDATGAPRVIADGRKNVTQLRNNGRGLPLSITDPLGRVTSMTYRVDSRPSSVSGADGVNTSLGYDARGNLTNTTMAGTSGPTLNSVYAYTADNRVSDSTAPDGVITHYTYTAAGQVETVTAGYNTPLAMTTRYQYDSIGRVIRVTSADGTPLARTDATSYNADSTVSATAQNYKDGIYDSQFVDEDVITTYGYDALGRHVWTRDILGRYDVTHYDAAGRVDYTVANFVQTGWNGGALPATPPNFDRTLPDRNVATTYSYDGLDRLDTTTQYGILSGTFDAATKTWSAATTRVSRNEYDTLNRLSATVANYKSGVAASADTNVRTETYYDGAGNVVWTRDALNRWTKNEYDTLGRLSKMIGVYENGNATTVDSGNASWTDGSDTDLITVMQYDTAGNLAYQIGNYIDGTYAVAQPSEDRITHTIYDTLLRPSSVVRNETSASNPPTDTNRQTSTSYATTSSRVLGSVDALGRITTSHYDALGRVDRTTQNCRDTSNAAAYEPNCAAYDSAKPDTNVSMSVVYDALGRAVQSIDPLGVVTKTDYDGMGRVKTTVRNFVQNGPTDNQTNITTRTTYDALGRMIVQTDAQLPTGATTQTSYDGLSRVSQTTDQLGRITQFGYDGTGVQRWMQTADGRLTVMAVDGLGRVTSTIQNYQDGTVDGSDGTDRDLVTTTAYNAGGWRTQVTNAGGQITTFGYDTRGLLTSVTENLASGSCATAPCNVQTRYSYDRNSNRTKVTDARNLVTRQMSYNAADEVVSQTDGAGKVTTYSYDRGGRVTNKGDPRGANDSLTYGYDNLDRPTSLVNGAATPLSIGMGYNARGDRVRLVDASGTTTFTPDALGRITQVVAPNTGTVGYAYDSRGERTSLTYPDGSVVGYSYAADGQMASVTQNSTTLAAYAYDNIGRLVQTARSNGQLTNYRYDNADRLTTQTTSVANTVVAGFVYSPNRAGLRTNVAEALPVTPAPSTTRIKTLTFEGASLTDGATGADSTNGTVVLDSTSAIKGKYAFKANNTVSTFVTEDFNGTSELYLSFYLRVDATPTADTQIAQVFNGATQVGNIQLTTGKTLRLRNNTTNVTSNVSSALTTGTTYRVLLHQKAKSGSSNNGVLEAFLATGDLAFGGAFATNSTQSFTTQATRVRLGSINSSNPVKIVVDDIALDMGSIPAASVATATRNVAYTYDGLYRLTGATEAGSSTASAIYSYDLAGNRTDGGRTYNAANQVSGWTYDNAGNLLSDGTTSYTYDSLSRVSGYTVGGTTKSNSYNGDDVLVAQTVGGTTTRYAQDLVSPLNLVLNAGGANAIYGLDRLASSTGSTKTWYATDALGSVRRTLNDTGASQPLIDYDAWGVVERGTVPTFGFTGEQQDGNLVNLRARWYNAGKGSFSSVDPFAGFPEQPYSLNQYQYGYSNPVLYGDPSGRNPALCFAALIAGPEAAPVTGGCLLVYGVVILTGAATVAAIDCVQRNCAVQAVQQIASSFSRPAEEPEQVSAPPLQMPPPPRVSPPMVPQSPQPSVTNSGGFSFEKACELPGGFNWLDPIWWPATTSAPWGTAGTQPGLVVSAISMSEQLRRNMIAAGLTEPVGSAAHHIVAWDDPRAAGSRGILLREGIGVNDAVNGVFLPINRNYPSVGDNIHSTIHTDRYYQELEQRLRRAVPGTVRFVLRAIATELEKGLFPVR